MELKKLSEHWNEFPEMSMEERPVLSSDLEKMALQNPFLPLLPEKKASPLDRGRHPAMAVRCVGTENILEDGWQRSVPAGRALPAPQLFYLAAVQDPVLRGLSRPAGAAAHALPP